MKKRENNIYIFLPVKNILLIALDKQFIHDYQLMHYLEKNLITVFSIVYNDYSSFP